MVQREKAMQADYRAVLPSSSSWASSSSSSGEMLARRLHPLLLQLLLSDFLVQELV